LVCFSQSNIGPWLTRFIECSGLHRSLGTHISKVRSLTLDVTSFTPDLVELLCQIGNKNSNTIWEAKFDAIHRPDPRSSREQRLKFITSKYVDRAFVQPLSPTLSQYASPDESILAAVKNNDLQGTLYALALHGSPNTVDPATGLHVIFLALQAADPTPTVPDNELVTSSTGLSSVTFPLAELLVQNGGEITSSIPSSGLSLAAKHYLSQKTAKRASAPPEATPSGAAAPSKASSKASSKHSHQSSSSEFYEPPATLRERQQREKERLQKRVSSGGRLHRAAQLER